MLLFRLYGQRPLRGSRFMARGTQGSRGPVDEGQNRNERERLYSFRNIPNPLQ